MTTEVQDAERDAANSKQRFQESLRMAGETGTRLAAEVRKKATPALVVAVVVGAAVTGVAFAVARSRARPRWRVPQQPSLARDLARTAGAWLLRTVALRLAAEMAARLREAQPSAPTPSHPA